MAHNKDKTDSELGLKVHKHLVSIGLETPFNEVTSSNKDKISIIEKNFKNILDTLGLDLSDDSLRDTPRRVAKMYVDEIFWGMHYESFPKCTTVDNRIEYDEMVMERGISVQSTCEHHFVIIDGFATVAYIPKEKVLGLSKMNRIVEYFSKRPQIQERLTAQIWHALNYILGTDNVAVLIDAQHYCVKSRGVEDTGCSTITSKLGGIFKDNVHTRNEFMLLANSK